MEPDHTAFDDEAFETRHQVPFGTPRTPPVELREDEEVIDEPEQVPAPTRRTPSNDKEGVHRNILDELDAETNPPSQLEPSPRSSTRIRKPNRKFRGDEWANYQGSRVANQRIRASALNEAYLQGLSWHSGA